jgi:hypothetical protein
VLAEEEKSHGGLFAGLTVSLQGRVLFLELADLGIKVARLVRFDEAWTEAVDADTVRRPFACEAFGEVRRGCLARVVECLREWSVADLGTHACGEDDGTLFEAAFDPDSGYRRRSTILDFQIESKGKGRTQQQLGQR